MQNIAPLLYVIFVPIALLALLTNLLDESDRFQRQQDWLLVKVTFTYCMLALGIWLFSERLFPLVERNMSSFGFPSSWTLSASIFTLATFALSIRLFKNWEDTATQKCGWILGACLMSFLGSASTLRLINGLFDRSPITSFTTTVIRKSMTGGKGSTHHLIVEDWKTPRKILRIEVDRVRYDMQRIGTKIQVTTKAGFLGHEWVLNVKEAPD